MDIQPIKDKMNKLLKVKHRHNKRALNLIIVGWDKIIDEKVEIYAL